MSRPVKHYDKWRIRWVDTQGKRYSRTFDDYNEAKRVLAQAQHEVEGVRVGLRVPVIQDKSFNDLCDYWITNRAPTKRSGNNDISIITKTLRPAFGNLKLRDLSVAHADEFSVKHAPRSLKTLANHLTLLISMLNKALDLNWIDRVPRIKKPKIRLLNRDYRYLRTDDEIRKFLLAAKDAGENIFALYAAAVYTGMRAGELGGLRWDDVDFDRRLIVVQRSFEGPTKSDDVRYVPILDPLLPVLREWRLKHPGQYVFTNEAGRPLQPSTRIFQEWLHDVLDAAGFKNVEINKKAAPYITFHCLRHTFASHWAMKGGDIFKLQKILGHKTVQMTMRYTHLVPEIYAEDYGRFGCASTIAPKNVTQLITGAPKA